MLRGIVSHIVNKERNFLDGGEEQVHGKFGMVFDSIRSRGIFHICDVLKIK